MFGTDRRKSIYLGIDWISFFIPRVLNKIDDCFLFNFDKMYVTRSTVLSEFDRKRYNGYILQVRWANL